MTELTDKELLEQELGQTVVSFAQLNEILVNKESVKDYLKCLPSLNSNKELNTPTEKQLAHFKKIIITSVNNAHILPEHMRKKIIPLIFNNYIAYKHYLYYLDAIWVIVIKMQFAKYITKEQIHELIPLYNELFTDNLYQSVVDEIEYEVPQNVLDRFVEQYRKEQEEKLRKAEADKKKPLYEVGEIVGARDKEGRWWMATVLAVFMYDNHIIYYVNFLGWSDACNEFITKPYYISKFNHYKHPYFKSGINHKKMRPLLNPKMLEDDYDEDSVNDDQEEKHASVM